MIQKRSQARNDDDGCVVAVDVGGTNTDVVMVADGQEYLFKLPSTNKEPSIATVEGILEICRRANIDPIRLNRILHGTTVATNAVVERKFGTIGMLTTAGFRDVLAIGRHKRFYNFSIHQSTLQETHPLVERRHIKEISERIVSPGVIAVPLSEEQVRACAGQLVEAGVDAIAICFLFSFLNPTHEKRAEAIIKESHSNVFTACSSDVAPVYREWERFSTTAISCCLMKKFSFYVSNITKRAKAAGMQSEVLIVQSSGGMSTAEQAAAKPVNFLYSGPAGGALLASHIGKILGEPNIIGVDIGGTTADIVAIKGGRIPERNARDSTVGGYPVAVPMLDIQTIGTGGGSIAWIDDGGGFNVGPHSAGAEPGPACYDRGGSQPTVTDAQLLLGRLTAGSFLGGALSLKADLATRAIQTRLCDHLAGIEFSDVPHAAMAIVDLANHKMAQAINNQTVRRGYDPREFSLFAFGGAGPLHACDLADILNIGKIIIPRWPGAGSARGFMTTDIRYAHAQTVNMPLEDMDGEIVAAVLDRHRKEGTAELLRSNVAAGDMVFRAALDCMYQGQGYDLRIDFAGLQSGWKEAVKSSFLKKHEDEYGHHKQDPIKIVNIRLDAIGRIRTVPLTEIPAGGADPSAALKFHQQVYFGSSQELRQLNIPRYEYDLLRANNQIIGPAIVDELDTTTVVAKGWMASVTINGFMLLTKLQA